MNNISSIHDCYGCGVCAVACPSKIISIKINSDGFYEPTIDSEDKCSSCGLCLDVCSYNQDNLSVDNLPLKSFGSWSKAPAVRRKCSSGGVGFEIGKQIIARGGKVCGVRFNADKNQAEHYVASSNEELIPSIGSKYIQSYTVDGFSEIVKQIKKSRKTGDNIKFLITGTPCQIDSFRRYVLKFRMEDSVVLLDFFCHGVPSKLMWDKYVAWAEKQVGKLTYVSWRNKFTGWHDSWAMSMDGTEHGESVDWHESYNLLIKGGKGYFNSRLSDGDMFYKMFLSDACLGKACYDKCKFKYDKSAADIRIGDLWGKTYENNDEGVSALICFTEKGKYVVESITNLNLTEHLFEVVAEGQMLKCPERTKLYDTLYQLLHIKHKGIDDIVNSLKKYYKTKRIKNIVKKIFSFWELRQK